MNFKKYHVSRNLVDAEEFAEGLVSNYGSITANENYITSDYIWFQTGIYTMSMINGYTGSGTTTNRIAVYNAQKEFIYCVVDVTGNRPERPQYTFSLNNDCYLRIGVRKTDTELMLNTGSTPQPYEPYSSEVWHDIPYYQHKTATDTLTLPAVIYPNDTSITVGIKGQSSQSGTPSSQSPVEVNGCGEMSSNLYNVPDKSATANSLVTLVDLGADVTFNSITVSSMFDNLLATSVNGAFLDFLTDSGTHQYVALSNMYNVSDDSPVQANTITNGNYHTTKNNLTFRYIKAYLYATAYNKFQSGTIKWAFYNSEKKDYEPYGYKIPILLNSQTINKYLGEVQTERKIKKFVLTGQEDWKKYSSTADSYLYYLTGLLRADVSDCICTHTPYSSSVPDGSDAGVRISDSRTVLLLNCGSTTISSNTKEDFKAWIAQQYTNGTPVTVWYVLATPQAAVVNEPLMKIGTYADSLTTSIPCTAGENTFDVDTTVQPSEVTATFEGWHPVQSVHERENGQWG